MRKARGRSLEEALEQLNARFDELPPRLKNRLFVAEKLFADGDEPSAWRQVHKIEAELALERRARELVTA